MEKVTISAQETQELGKHFAAKIKNGGLVCLVGDLGSGKTTFTQGVAAGLGISARIVSPTFVLIRRYALDDHRFLWHIDLYRLNNLEEVETLGIDELVADPQNIVLIEWPEKIKPLLPKNHLEVKFKNLGNDQHEIIY